MRLSTLVSAGSALAMMLCGTAATNAVAAPARPNILFVILDDVGVDQMSLYGFGGVLPPRLPNIDRIAAAGLTFTNVWGMPECSSSRAAYFTGRYPSRTGVEMAIIGNHLPQTYVSPFETTLPRVLEKAGYESALVGKYHLGEAKDPAEHCAPASRGWDAFYGNMTAGPPSIDLTAGGIDSTGSQACGYFQTDDAGACYTSKSGAISCAEIDGPVAGATPSRSCLQRGGIFAPGLACSDPRPAGLDFSRTNAYYVWPRSVSVGARSPYTADTCGRTTASRGYMSTIQSRDGASWWNAQTGPRMLTLSLNAIHTPFQKAPTSLVPDPLDRTSACNMLLPERFLINSVLEGADAALGKAMEAMGLATLARDGRTIASLNLADTLLVIVGDNGSYGSTVRVADGFDPARSKGTVYQAGVWVPLIVAGGPVQSPGRTVDDLVNVADLFGLFANIAGVDAKTAVPASHRLDARDMTRYLRSTDPTPARTVNYSELGTGIFTDDPDERSWPCVVGNACSDTIFQDEALCRDNGGAWYGPGSGRQQNSCCAVAAANPSLGITLTPLSQRTARNGSYKLVRSSNFACDRPLAENGTKALPWAEYETETWEEFYDVRRTTANPNGLDDPDDDLLSDCTASDPASCLPRALRDDYRTLAGEIDRVADATEGEAACRAKGDGNLDRRVSAADVTGWKAFDGEGPSRYDVNVDGETDEDDLAIIEANLDTDCMSMCSRADLDRSGKLDDRDRRLLVRQTGACDPVTCSGDLDGDGKVDKVDESAFDRARLTCRNGRQEASAR